MRKGAIWARHAYNRAKRANDTSVLRVEVRIYIAVRTVVNRKASIRHHGRVGRRDIPLSILLAHAFNIVSLREGSGACVEVTCDGRILNSGPEVLRMCLRIRPWQGGAARI